MALKEYFDKLPNRLSANFFAMIGFANFVLIFGFLRDFSNINLKDFLLLLGLIYFVFGAIAIACCLLLLPLLLLLVSSNKKTSIIAFFIFITLYIFIMHRLYIFFIIDFEILELFNLYNYAYQILLYLFLLLITHFIDIKSKFYVKNTFLLNNRFYKKFVTIFYYYFWILYIPFFIVYSVILCASI